MALITRSETIQARVSPLIKEASERVLWRIGLNMSEAMELFLRRIIIDKRIPFEIVALDTNDLLQVAKAGPAPSGQDTSRGRIENALDPKSPAT
jgi:addiction module RelB/DinJ family antitoxin